METTDLYNDILRLLPVIKDDEEKLTKVISFLEDQILGDYKVESKTELPEEYKDTIQQIADAVDTGVVCYLNPETMEIEQVQNRTIFDSEEYEEQNDDMLDEFAINHLSWDSYIRFEPMEKEDIYRMMENFVSELNNTKLASQLENALSGEKPMEEFIRTIDKYGKIDLWLTYKKQETVNSVKNLLLDELRLR